MLAGTIARRPEPAGFVRPDPESHRANRPPLVLGACWLVLAAAIPIQWYSIVRGTAGVLRYFHLAAALFALAYLSWRGSAHPLRRVLRATIVFQIAIAYWVVLLVLAHAYNGVSSANTFQQAVYAFIALLVAGFFASLQNIGPAEDPGCWKLLRWSALVALSSFAFFFLRAALAKGLDPLGLLIEAVRSANPSILEFSLFRPVLASETAGAYLRHEIFASLLVMMWVSVHAHQIAPLQNPWRRFVYRMSITASVVSIAISLSRSVILALLVGAAVSPLRSLVQGRLARKKAAFLLVLFGATCVAGASGLFGILLTRFTVDTGSYVERVSAIRSSFDTNPLFGGAAGGSAHNFVLDSWLQGGILAALAAVAALVSILIAWGRTLRQCLHSAVTRHGPTTAVAAIVTLPVVRLVTAGGGVLHLTEWLALAFFAGYLVGADEPPFGVARSDRSRPSTDSS